MSDDKNKKGAKVKVGEANVTITDPYGIRNFAGRRGKHSTGIDIVTSNGSAIALTSGTVVEVKAQSGKEIIDLTNFNSEDSTQAQKYENAKRVMKPTEGASGGFFVTIKHPDGTYGKYMHLDPISSEEAKNLIGKQVNRGESLGTYNQQGSGSMTGKHVKFRAFTDLNDSSKTHINPLAYLTGEKDVIPTEVTLSDGTAVTQSSEGTDVQPFSMDGIDPEKFRNFVAAYKKEEDKAEIKEKKTKESDARKAIEEAKKQKALYESKKRESFMNLMAEMSKEDEVRKPQMKQESPQQDFQMLTMQKSLPELPSIHRLPEFQDGGAYNDSLLLYNDTQRVYDILNKFRGEEGNKGSYEKVAKEIGLPPEEGLHAFQRLTKINGEQPKAGRIEKVNFKNSQGFTSSISVPLFEKPKGSEPPILPTIPVKSDIKKEIVYTEYPEPKNIEPMQLANRVQTVIDKDGKRSFRVVPYAAHDEQGWQSLETPRVIDYRKGKQLNTLDLNGMIFQDGGEQISYYQDAGTAQALTKKQKREQDYYKLTMMMREGYKHLSPETGKVLTPGELLFEGGEPIKKYEEKGFTPLTTKDFITWKVSGEDFTPDPNSFIDTGISPFSREDFETDEAYNEAYQKDRVVLAPRVVPKYGTMYVPIGTGKRSQKIAEEYNKQYGSYKVKKKQIIPYYTPPESNFEEFEKYRQQRLQAPQQMYGGLFEDIGEVSRMGYRDDSPYRDREYIDIQTPTGVIDMSNTGIPLYANGRLLMPYSGQHQMGTTVVREVPAGE